jgi:DNA replication protein DnaC
MTDSLDRLMLAIEQRRQNAQRRIDSTPRVLPCPSCGHNAHLDETSLWDDMGREQSPVYVCPVCTARRHREQRQRRLERDGIPPDVRHASLANFDVDRPRVDARYHSPLAMMHQCQELAKGRIRNLILSGTVGIGKGHLAAALCIERIDSGRTVAWREISQLYRQYHRAYATSDTERVVAPLKSASLLVLDEVALRQQPADGEEILFAVLDARHKARLQTVLLSNLPLPEIRSWLGERVSDRLMSGGVGYAFGVWESMRGREGF